MRVHWTLEATQDRVDIFDYLASKNPAAAVRIDSLFSDAARRLADFPALGPIGRVPGTRELVPHENYCLIYEVDEIHGVVSILTLVHTARQWPPLRP